MCDVPNSESRLQGRMSNRTRRRSSRAFGVRAARSSSESALFLAPSSAAAAASGKRLGAGWSTHRPGTDHGTWLIGPSHSSHADPRNSSLASIGLDRVESGLSNPPPPRKHGVVSIVFRLLRFGFAGRTSPIGRNGATGHRPRFGYRRIGLRACSGRGGGGLPSGVEGRNIARVGGADCVWSRNAR